MSLKSPCQQILTTHRLHCRNCMNLSSSFSTLLLIFPSRRPVLLGGAARHCSARLGPAPAATDRDPATGGTAAGRRRRGRVAPAPPSGPVCTATCTVQSRRAAARSVQTGRDAARSSRRRQDLSSCPWQPADERRCTGRCGKV